MQIDNNSSDRVFRQSSEEETQITNMYFETMIRFSHKTLTKTKCHGHLTIGPKKKILNGSI